MNQTFLYAEVMVLGLRNGAIFWIFNRNGEKPMWNLVNFTHVWVISTGRIAGRLAFRGNTTSTSFSQSSPTSFSQSSPAVLSAHKQ